jgi:hypothetical protein
VAVVDGDVEPGALNVSSTAVDHRTHSFPFRRFHARGHARRPAVIAYDQRLGDVRLADRDRDLEDT